MSLVFGSHETIATGGKSKYMTSFFRNRIKDMEDAAFNVSGQTIYGKGEIVWFLNNVETTPIITYHETHTKDKVLCLSSFGENIDCPACEEHARVKDQYENDYKSMPVKARRQMVVFPIYIPRRGREGHIYTSQKNRSQILPIYWLEISINSFYDEHRMTFERLKDVAASYPLSQTPYQIFSPHRAEKAKTEWFFQPVGYDPNTMGVVTDHPILKPPYFDTTNPVSKGWDDFYYEMMRLLPMLGFVRPIDPQTGQPHALFGQWDRALQIYNWTKEVWPESVVKLAPPAAPAPAAPPVQQYIQQTYPQQQPMQSVPAPQQQPVQYGQQY